MACHVCTEFVGRTGNAIALIMGIAFRAGARSYTCPFHVEFFDGWISVAMDDVSSKGHDEAQAVACDYELCEWSEQQEPNVGWRQRVAVCRSRVSRVG